MKNYIQILSYGRPYLRKGMIGVFWLLLYTLFSAISLISIIPFLEILFSETKAFPLPDIPFEWANPHSIKVYSYYHLHLWIAAAPSKMTVLWVYCGILLGSIFLKGLSRYLSEYFINPLEQGIVKEIREKIFVHLTKLGLPFYTTHKKGNILNVLSSDVQVIEEAVIGTVMSLLRDPLTMITFLVSLLVISWRLTLFTLLVLPLTAFFLNIISKTLKKSAKAGQETLGDLTIIAEEFISGIRVVKSYQKEEFEANRYKKKNLTYQKFRLLFRNRLSMASPVTELISVLIVCIILLYGGSMIINGTLRANEFIGFIAVFSQFIMPLRNLSTAISKANKATVSYQRILELLEIDPIIKNKENPKPLHEFEKSLRFEEVWFKYKEENVLQNINFMLEKGQMLAIVGPSGGGKSTLADLVPRFYDPNQGKILLDGIDIRELDLFDLRKQIGYVTQEGVLFHDSILNNIAYGIENPNLAEVKRAAQIANAEEFILNLPAQYNTIIGERGTMLSGGQRQRISIARAVLRNPKILILDEATSNLDTESEKYVQDALDKLMENRTSIVIAHRLSTILKADKIMVIEKGKIVEAGSHEELLAANGVYKRLYEVQFGE
jgi:subfamily B ATP-binding cassette protein MsbA